MANNKDIKLYDYEWFCIYKNYKYDYFDKPKTINNNKILYWVKRTYNGRRCFAKENFNNKLFDIEFYDIKLRKTNIKIGNIECIEARDICHLRKPNEKYIDTDFVIKDQYNETFEITFYGHKENNSLPNIIGLIKKLIGINKEGSIELYFKHLDFLFRHPNKEWTPKKKNNDKPI